MNDDPFSPNLRRVSPGDLLMLKEVPTSPNGHSANSPPSNETTDCPDCGNFGWYTKHVQFGDPDFGKLQRCACRQAGDQKKTQSVALKRLGDELGTKYAHCTFDTFNLDRPLDSIYLIGIRYVMPWILRAMPEKLQGGAKEITAATQAPLLVAGYEAARSYAEAPSRWLYLHGSFGAGKSHLAAAIGHTRAALGENVRYRSTPGLLDAIKAGFSDGTSDATFHDVLTCDLLILDDLGVEHLTGWAQERLFRLLNERQELPTVITSNAHPDDLPIGDDLQAGRIASRLVGNARCVWLPISDYRRIEHSTQ